MLGVGDEVALVGERGGIGHVDGDGVAVAQGRRGDQLVDRRPGVAVGDDAVQAHLVQVGRLELEHLVDAVPVDAVGGGDQLAG